jgi:4-aminobutyrate aminotransferase
MTATEPRTTTGAETQRWLDRYDEAVAGVLPSYFPLIAASAEGSWITDVEGNRFLDFGSGIAVTNVGHGHPHVVAAVEAQVRELIHTSVVFRHRRYIELAEAIGRLAPFFERPQVFLCNSGAEAVDGALKLARQVTGKGGVIAFRRAFHGRTLAATSLTTAKGKYREGYAPLLGGIDVAPYCVPSEHPSEEAAVAAALGELDLLLALQAPDGNVGAMIVEPVLGEGGYVVPPVAWLQGLRERCDAHGILLVFDEVQCGMGRTGHGFAAETFGVAPDVLLFAKGVASGLPLGGVVAPAAVMERWPNGTHGSTFGGNPVACAAALATIEVMERDGLFERAATLGRRAVEHLRAVADRSDGRVTDVRGIGLMVGLDLRDADLAQAVQQRCLDEGLVVLTCGPGENVLRLVPPLTLTDEELDLGLTILEGALG